MVMSSRRSVRVFIRILSFLKNYWRWLLSGFACLLLTTAFGIAGPELMKRAIDTGIAFDFKTGKASGDQTLLIILGLAILVLSLFRGWFGFGRTYLGELVSQRVTYDLRNTDLSVCD